MKKNQNFKKRGNVHFLHRKGIFMCKNLTYGLILSRLSRVKMIFSLHLLLQNFANNRNFAIFAPHLAYEVQ